jgi:hypothetical protein
MLNRWPLRWVSRHARRGIMGECIARRSAPMARSWPGGAMRKLDPWRFASPSRGLKRLGSRMMQWALLQRQALARPPTGPKSKHLQAKSSLASGLPLRRRRPFTRGIRRTRRRPKLAPRAKAGRTTPGACSRVPSPRPCRGADRPADRWKRDDRADQERTGSWTCGDHRQAQPIGIKLSAWRKSPSIRISAQR